MGKYRLLLLALIVTATVSGSVLRFRGITDFNLDGEEECTVKVARDMSYAELWVHIAGMDNHPPLFYWLVKFMLWVTRDDLYSARYVSALFGVLSIPAVAWLVYCKAGPFAAVTAAFACAFMPSLVVFSRLGRMFVPGAFFVILSWVVLEKRKPWLYFCFITLALLLEYSMASVLVAQIAWLLFIRSERFTELAVRPLIMLLVLFLGLFFLTGISPASEEHSTIMLYALERYTLHTYQGMLISAWTGREPLEEEHYSRPWFYLFMATMLLAIVLPGRKSHRKLAVQSATWLIMPLILGIILSALAGFINPGAGILQAKIMVSGMPAIAVMAGIAGSGGAVPAALATSGIIISAIPYLDRYYNLYGADDAVKSVRIMERMYQPGDAIIFPSTSDFGIYMSKGRERDYYLLQTMLLLPRNYVPPETERALWASEASGAIDALTTELTDHIGESERIWLFKPELIIDRADELAKSFLRSRFNLREEWRGREYSLFLFSTDRPVSRGQHSLIQREPLLKDEQVVPVSLALTLMLVALLLSRFSGRTGA